MKRFLWLLILAGVGYAVWKYYPEIEHRARLLTDEVVAGGAVNQDTQATVPGETEPAGSPEATTAAATRPADAQKMTAANQKTAVVEAAPDDEYARRYPMPTFKEIEELVGDWKTIPASAFPRKITLNAPARLQLSGGVGFSTLEAGRTVYALSSPGDGTIIIAPSPDGVMRGPVKIEDTDFKVNMAKAYEQFKKRKIEEVTRLRAQARTAAASSLATVLSTEAPELPAAVLSKIGPRPAQNTDLRVPAAVTSIQERRRANKNADPPLEDITQWQAIRFQEVKGEPYWAVGVRFTARTLFGEFPTDATALIRHGKVEKWIYAGSGEPLP